MGAYYVMRFVTKLGSFTMQVISPEACEISHMLQVHFFFLHHTKSHEGHEGNEGRQEGGSTSPSQEGHENHEVNMVSAGKDQVTWMANVGR